MGRLSGSWSISASLLTRQDCLPTSAYPAFSSEPKFAVVNQEAGT